MDENYSEALEDYIFSNQDVYNSYEGSPEEVSELLQQCYIEEFYMKFPYMFPALIKHYDIDISTSAKYNDTTKEFKIASVDWVNKIITTDKKVLLPNIQNEPNAQYWQIYLLEPLSDTTLLQLTHQINSNTFGFKIESTQTQDELALTFIVNTIIGFRNPQQTWIPLSLIALQDALSILVHGVIDTAEIYNMGSDYSDGDSLYITDSNPNPHYYSQAFLIKVTDNPYNVTIDDSNPPPIIYIGNPYDVGGYVVNQIVGTTYSERLPNDGTIGTGDGNLTIKVLSVKDELYTLPSFVNHTCRYISRQNDKFIALILFNAGSSYVGYGIATSDDFITWSYINRIFPLSIGSLPSWMDYTSVIIPCMSSNNVNGNIHTLLFQQIGKGLGIMTTTDFIHYTYSANKFTYTGTINGGNVVTMSEGSYMYYKGIHYIGLTVQLSNDLRPNPYVACIFTWSGNLNNMSLTLVQTLGLNRPQHSWNCGYTELPIMFEVNSKLYCICTGDDNGYVGEIGNVGKTNGLYLFNDSTGLFEEYMSNPIILNVEFDAAYTGYRDHQDACPIYPYNSKLYAMPCFNEGSNTYKVIPAQICMKNKDTVDIWLKQTLALNQ